jgi:hypothetical protein
MSVKKFLNAHRAKIRRTKRSFTHHPVSAVYGWVCQCKKSYSRLRGRGDDGDGGDDGDR